MVLSLTELPNSFKIRVIKCQQIYQYSLCESNKIHYRDSVKNNFSKVWLELLIVVFMLIKIYSTLRHYVFCNSIYIKIIQTIRKCFC